MRPTVLLLALSAGLLSAGLAASPCLGQGVPPNPFASNHPSAPPALERGERVRASQTRRRPPPRPAERGLVPPGEVPRR